MANFVISTGAMSNAARQAALAAQEELVKKQTEIVTGRKADIGLEIGHRSSELVTLRQTLVEAVAIQGSNAIVATRLQSSQSALTDIDKIANEFLGGILAASRASAAATPIVSQSRSLLQALISRVNGEVAGEYVFGGLNVAEPPLVSYLAEGGSVARTSIQAAFHAAFGMSSDDPSVTQIDPGDMRAFLDGTFAAEFEDPAWSDHWSNASSENRSARIGLSERQEVGANANDAPFRQLAMALVMVGDLGTTTMSDTTRAVVLDKATELVGSAITGIAGVRSRLGLAEQRVAAADVQLSLQVDLIGARQSKIEVADPYVTATELNDLMGRLEASYATTARIQRLSLLDYL